MTDTRNDTLAAIAKGVLWVLSLVYGLVVVVTRGLYALRILPVYQASKPVISIGNITAGGSGKTPLTIWLVKQLVEQKIKPVILTRGYMPQPGVQSDEADMLNAALPDVPMMVGSDRKQSIINALKALPVDVFVCDDAFQHWPLKRDLDIVAIDASNPFGNGYLLPRGILREDLSALKRAHVFVLTKTDQGGDLTDLHEQLIALNPQALIVDTRYQSMCLVNVFNGDLAALDTLHDKPVASLCAIANPASFMFTLKDLKMNVTAAFDFMDHHVYTPQDIMRVSEHCRMNKIDILLTTHKDAVKIKNFKDLFNGIQVLYLRIEIDVTQGKHEFIQRVGAACRR